jgi:hypothetical protein
MNVEIGNEAPLFHSGNNCFEFWLQCVLQFGNMKGTLSIRRRAKESSAKDLRQQQSGKKSRL